MSGKSNDFSQKGDLEQKLLDKEHQVFNNNISKHDILHDSLRYTQNTYSLSPFIYLNVHNDRPFSFVGLSGYDQDLKIVHKSDLTSLAERIPAPKYFPKSSWFKTLAYCLCNSSCYIKIMNCEFHSGPYWSNSKEVFFVLRSLNPILSKFLLEFSLYKWVLTSSQLRRIFCSLFSWQNFDFCDCEIEKLLLRKYQKGSYKWQELGFYNCPGVDCEFWETLVMDMEIWWFRHWSGGWANQYKFYLTADQYDLGLSPPRDQRFSNDTRFSSESEMEGRCWSCFDI